MQKDFDEPNFAEPGESEYYKPEDDVSWWYKNFNYPRIQKFKYTLIEIIIFIIVIALLIPVFIPFRSGIVVDSKWSEAKTAMGSIKAVVDSYNAKKGGDISGLDEPKGALKEGFMAGSSLLEKLKLDHNIFDTLQYFNADDFAIEFVTDGTDGLYIITVNSTEGGGLSGNGPAGTGSYNSEIKTWTGDLE